MTTGSDIEVRLEPMATGEDTDWAEPLTTLTVLRDSIARDVARLREHDPLVRADRDREAVHQARVATRRLRAQLQTFGKLLRAAPAAELTGELRWLGTLLGRVRDLDVLGERLIAGGTSEVDEERRRPILGQLGIERQEMFAELIASMRSKRYRRLVRCLDEAALLPPV
ncbi:MAG: CHAD domain-containing protein, partial [Acidimicrobiales bacterium]